MRERYPRTYQNIPRRYPPLMPEEQYQLEVRCGRAASHVSNLIGIPLLAWAWVHFLLLGTRVPHSSQGNVGDWYLQWYSTFVIIVYGSCWTAVYTACKVALAPQYRAQFPYKAAVVKNLRALFSAFPIVAFFVFIMSYVLPLNWGTVGDRPVGQYLFRLATESIAAFCLATSVGYAAGSYAQYRSTSFLSRLINRWPRSRN